MSTLFDERSEKDRGPFHSPTPSHPVASGRPAIPRWKFVLDWGLILATSPVWAPLMACLSLFIKLVSRGPVLFAQERVGYGGRNFVCLKFRTMRNGANTNLHDKHVVNLMRSNSPLTKMDQKDNRLIPLGWVLRSTGLDELPQLMNILRGEMSLVGPRPCTPREYSFYAAPQRRRTESVPGLTGLWQVSGKNKTTFAEMIHLDLRYQEELSLWLDLRILLKTPCVLIAQLGETISERGSKKSASSQLPSELTPRQASATSKGLVPSTETSPPSQKHADSTAAKN